MKTVLILLASGAILLADATGKWAGTFAPSNGREGPALLVLKQEGEKLTGTVGPSEDQRFEIANGKVSGAELTFEVTTPNSTMKFVLKQEDEEIKGEASRELDGQKQTAKLAVKRQK